MLDVVVARVGNGLRSPRNEVMVTLDTSAGYASLPSGLNAIRTVIANNSAVPYIPLTVQRDGTEHGYATHGGTLYYDAGDTLDIYYWRTPQMAGDGSGDAVMAAQPYLYLYGMLSEVYRYLGDREAANDAATQFFAELVSANKTAERNRAAGAAGGI